MERSGEVEVEERRRGVCLRSEVGEGIFLLRLFEHPIISSSRK